MTLDVYSDIPDIPTNPVINIIIQIRSILWFGKHMILGVCMSLLTFSTFLIFPTFLKTPTFQTFPIYYLAKTPGLYQVPDHIDLVVWKTYDTWCLCVSPDTLNIPDIPDIPNIPEDPDIPDIPNLLPRENSRSLTRPKAEIMS